MRKCVSLLLLLALACFAGLADDGKDCLDCKPVYGGLPIMVGSAYVPFESLTVLENRTYIVGYSESRMNPLWVSYRAYEVAGDGTAPDDFAWRIDCRTDSGVTYDDFTHTRYQRGHFAPKETMYDCYGTLGVFDSFLLSNTSPQIGGFNGGIWSALERRIREEYCEIFG